MDGVGVGELPDAADYGDRGTNTVAHIATSQNLKVPFLASLGLAKLVPDLQAPESLTGAFGKMNEASPGKDSTTGHWEMAGIVLEKAFLTYPKGFPNAARPRRQPSQREVPDRLCPQSIYGV